jgi:hypothetical protein
VCCEEGVYREREERRSREGERQNGLKYNQEERVVALRGSWGGRMAEWKEGGRENFLKFFNTQSYVS